MTYSPMRDLKEFHDKYHHERTERPIGEYDLNTLRLRKNLIREEYGEVTEQIEYFRHVVAYKEEYEDINVTLDSAIEDLAKELADLLYVVYGTAEELGIPLEEVFQKVHQSNMDKLWPDGTIHYNKEGKVLKPPTYSPPDLSFVNERRI